jgi:hypothetical protein
MLSSLSLSNNEQMSLPPAETTRLQSDALAVCMRTLGRDNVHIGYNDLIHITKNPLLRFVIKMYSASSGVLSHSLVEDTEETVESFGSLYALEQILYKVFPVEWQRTQKR